ncbi:hypothetical protein HNQ56_001262 [Anaerotaenia torta]
MKKKGYVFKKTPMQSCLLAIGVLDVIIDMSHTAQSCCSLRYLASSRSSILP